MFWRKSINKSKDEDETKLCGTHQVEWMNTNNDVEKGFKNNETV